MEKMLNAGNNETNGSDSTNKQRQQFIQCLNDRL